jgi:glycosyltransferase involved in cell wall biosynthesis
MMQKTVWIVNQYAGSPKHGMEYRHYYLAQEFVNKGYRVAILSGSYSHLFTEQPHVSDIYNHEQISDIDYYWLKVPSYKKSTSLGRIINMLVFTYRFYKLPQKKLAKPDIIIVSSPSLFPILPAKRWAKKYGAQLIFEVRDIWPLTLEALSGLKSHHPLIWLMKKVERYAYRNSDYIVSLLPNAKSHFVTQGMAAEKFSYIPNGIDLNEVTQATPLSLIIENQIPKDKFIVGYTGAIGISNALEYLIDAIIQLQEHTDIFFVIVGKGDRKAELQEKCSTCNNVLFLPPIPKNQIQSILRFFDICFIAMHQVPLYQYGISLNKMFDYMYSGKPILASLESPNNPAEQSGGSLMVAPENTEAIIRGILELKSMDPENRQVMGNKGKAFVLANHTYQSIAKKYIALFKD